jgi:hypothetical protein
MVVEGEGRSAKTAEDVEVWSFRRECEGGCGESGFAVESGAAHIRAEQKMGNGFQASGSSVTERKKAYALPSSHGCKIRTAEMRNFLAAHQHVRVTPHQSNAIESIALEESAMDENITANLLNELSSALESSETQSAALLQFLKDKGIVTDEEFAPYLERASNAANVRAVAARLRMKSLLSSAIRTAEEMMTRKVEEALRSQENQRGEARETEAETRHEKRGERETAANREEEKQKKRTDGTSRETEPQQQLKKETEPQQLQKQSTRNESEEVIKSEEVTKNGEPATADSQKKSTDDEDDKKGAKAA